MVWFTYNFVQHFPHWLFFCTFDKYASWLSKIVRGCCDRDHDRMVVGFTTTCANHCLSPLKLWVRTAFMLRCTSIQHYVKHIQWLVTGRWFSPGTPVSSTNKTDRHDITEILLKVALNTITLTTIQNTWITYHQSMYYATKSHLHNHIPHNIVSIVFFPPFFFQILPT